MVEHADAKPAGPVRAHHPDFPRVSGSLDTGSNTARSLGQAFGAGGLLAAGVAGGVDHDPAEPVRRVAFAGAGHDVDVLQDPVGLALVGGGVPLAVAVVDVVDQLGRATSREA